MLYLVLTIVALLGATIMIFAKKGKRTTNDILKVFLLWVFAINIGVGGLLGFVGHTFSADNVALYIGWMPGSPFQFEVAITNLMLGVLGFMCLWFKDDVWLVTVVASTIFGWGSAYGHVRDMLINHNYVTGNVGAPLYIDIVAPSLMIILFSTYKLTKNKKKVVETLPKAAPKTVAKITAKATPKKRTTKVVKKTKIKK